MTTPGNIIPETVRVHLKERSYSIQIAPGILRSTSGAGVQFLTPFLSGKKVLLVADSNTGKLYGNEVLERLRAAGASEVGFHTFKAGEASKKFSEVEKICRTASRLGLDRSSLLVALGGGVVGDMTAFAASIYMRGIAFLQIPTTLLAMIDSSVGGKTGVDLPEGKNLIGTFHQPKLVLMDPEFLKTLPRPELRCGFSELLKHAMILDRKLGSVLLDHAADLLDLKDLPLLTQLIARSCAIKAHVVERDEREGSIRVILNYGHSFGHAIEKELHFKGITHGDAIAVGMSIAGELAVSMGLLKVADMEAQNELIHAFELPLTVSGCKPARVYRSMSGDKKNLGGNLRVVLPRRIGKVEIISNPPEKLLVSAIRNHCND